MSQVTQPDVIPVWPDQPPDADLRRDAGPELELPRRENSQLLRNVSQPTLTVFLPEPRIAVGAGVVVCPGGAFHFLMLDKEGSEIARWLNARGVAAFILKYLVFPTADDDASLLQIAANPLPHRANMDRVRPVPPDAPPLFLAAAGDDEVVDPRHSLSLYTAWHAAGRRADIHLYAHGGHGFALIPQGLPSDTWIDRFWEWLRAEGFVPATAPRE